MAALDDPRVAVVGFGRRISARGGMHPRPRTLETESLQGIEAADKPLLALTCALDWPLLRVRNGMCNGAITETSPWIPALGKKQKEPRRKLAMPLAAARCRLGGPSGSWPGFLRELPCRSARRPVQPCTCDVGMRKPKLQASRSGQHRAPFVSRAGQKISCCDFEYLSLGCFAVQHRDES
jgi:hypothetical protein